MNIPSSIALKIKMIPNNYSLKIHYDYYILQLVLLLLCPTSWDFAFDLYIYFKCSPTSEFWPSSSTELLLLCQPNGALCVTQPGRTLLDFPTRLFTSITFRHLSHSPPYAVIWFGLPGLLSGCLKACLSCVMLGIYITASRLSRAFFEGISNWSSIINMPCRWCHWLSVFD